MAESFIGTTHAPVSAGLAGSGDPARHPAEPSTSRAAAAPTPVSAGLAGSGDPARHPAEPSTSRTAAAPTPVSAGLAGSGDPARHPAEPSTSRAAAAPTPVSAGLAGSGDPARHPAEPSTSRAAAAPTPVPSNKSTSGRQFRSEWMGKYPFLDYHEDRECVTCRSCCSAVGKDLMRKSDFREVAFLNGFRNWKKALDRFAAHAKSETHLKAAEKLVLCRSAPVDAVASNAHKKEQQKNRAIYKEIICMIRGLGRCGVALRGHSSSDGNLWALLEERAVTDEAMRRWIEKENQLPAS